MRIKPADRPAPTSVRWLIKNLLRKRGAGVGYGPPGVGKTAISIDLCCHVATGKPWHGYKISGGPVVYVAGEDHDGAILAIQAWEKQNSLEQPTLVDVIPGPLNLTPNFQGKLTKDLSALVDDIKEAVGEYGSVALIVFDTLASVWHDESNDGMADFLGITRELSDRFDCAVLIIHHTGKDETKGERGGSALRGGVDLSLECRRAGDLGCLTAVKVRGAPDNMKWGFTLEVVELGTDADGDPITATVAHPSVAPTSARRLTPGRKIVLQTLLILQACRTNGADITYTEWKDAAYNAIPEEDTNKRRTFRDAAKWLVAEGFVDHRTDYVTVAPNIVIPPDIRRTLEDVQFAAGPSCRAN